MGQFEITNVVAVLDWNVRKLPQRITTVFHCLFCFAVVVTANRGRMRGNHQNRLGEALLGLKTKKKANCLIEPLIVLIDWLCGLSALIVPSSGQLRMNHDDDDDQTAISFGKQRWVQCLGSMTAGTSPEVSSDSRWSLGNSKHFAQRCNSSDARHANLLR